MFPCSASRSYIMNIYTVIDIFVKIVAGMKNVRIPVESFPIHQRNNIRIILVLAIAEVQQCNSLKETLQEESFERFLC